jgi:hypothetical protein
MCIALFIRGENEWGMGEEEMKFHLLQIVKYSSQEKMKADSQITFKMAIGLITVSNWCISDSSSSKYLTILQLS